MKAAGIDGFVPNVGVDGPRKLNRKTAEDWNGWVTDKCEHKSGSYLTKPAAFSERALGVAAH